MKHAFIIDVTVSYPDKNDHTFDEGGHKYVMFGDPVHRWTIDEVEVLAENENDRGCAHTIAIKQPFGSASLLIVRQLAGERPEYTELLRVFFWTRESALAHLTWLAKRKRADADQIDASLAALNE